MAFLPGWPTPKTVEAINSFFEYLETISLAAAIALELSGMRLSSDVAWVVLVISDIGRQVYGRRDKLFSEMERAKLEKRFEWGVISALDRERIRAALFPPTPVSGKRVWIYALHDSLSREYGLSLWNLLRSATLVVFTQQLILPAGLERPGLHITGPDEASAKFLADVLSDNGIEVSSTNEVSPLIEGHEGNVPEGSRPDIEIHIAGRP